MGGGVGGGERQMGWELLHLVLLPKNPIICIKLLLVYLVM